MVVAAYLTYFWRSTLSLLGTSVSVGTNIALDSIIFLIIYRTYFWSRFNMDLVTPPHPECTVSGIMGFILRLSRVAGVAPLKITSTRDGYRIQVSHNYSLYGEAVVLIFGKFNNTMYVKIMFRKNTCHFWSPFFVDISNRTNK